MAYLIYNDFKRLIQSDNLSQIIGANYSLLDAEINVAVAEAKSYLRQKYDVANEFDDTPQYGQTTHYTYKQRVYVDATTYNPATVYGLYDYVLHEGLIYYANNAGITGTWDANQWVYLCKQYDIYTSVLPSGHTEFNLYATYAIGDDVVYKGRQYTALQASSTPTYSIDNVRYENTGVNNVLPDAVDGAQYWDDNGAYDFYNQLLDDSTYWEQTDNRNQQMVNTVVDIALYHVHSRIAPRNIPDLRVKRYDDSISWLKQCAKGDDITADLPLIQPKQGARIRWGGAIKQNNTY